MERIHTSKIRTIKQIGDMRTENLYFKHPTDKSVPVARVGVAVVPVFGAKLDDGGKPIIENRSPVYGEFEVTYSENERVLMPLSDYEYYVRGEPIDSSKIEAYYSAGADVRADHGSVEFVEFIPATEAEYLAQVIEAIK